MSQTALTIGTEYSDRFITGTGTEEDPWIIGGYVDTSHDLQNLLDAVYTPNAYVKLLKNIEAAKDVTYREGIDHAITIAAAKLYADEKVKVSGLVVNTDYCIKIEGNYEHTIERIQVLSCIHNGKYPTVYGLSNTLYPAYFIECDFSVIKRSGHPQFSQYAVNFDHCSINLEVPYVSGVTSAAYVFATSLKYEYCTIRYDGILYSAGSGYYLIENGDRVGITGRIIFNSSTNWIFRYCNYCYFAGIVSAASGTVTVTRYSGDNCFFCITETEGENAVLLDETAFEEITPEQLKDRDYLYSIGFLP